MKKYPVFKTIKRTLNEVWVKNKWLFVLSAIYTIIAAIYPLAGVYLPRFLIEELQMFNIDFERIILIIIIFTGITGVFGFFDIFITNVIDSKIMMIRVDLLLNIFDKYNRIDYHYTEDPDFQNNSNDTIVAVSGNEGFEEIIKRMFKFGSKALLAIIYMIIISKLSYWVILAIALSVVIGIINSLIIKKFRYKNKTELAKSRRKINYFERMTQDFSYGKDIRLYDFQDRITKSYDFEIASYISIIRKIKNKEYLLAFIDLLFVLISDAVLYYILVTKVIEGMPIAEFSMYLIASLALSTLLKVIGEDVTYIFGQGQYMNDYFEFMKTEFNEVKAGLEKVNNDTLEIEFKNVSFKYPKTDKWIIKDLNLKINKGEKLAIVGINGAGKTTLVKLILRLFKPDVGEIFVNGINANEYDLEAYQEMFSPVFQDIHILAFTIRENITLGLSNDEERIWKCLDAVGLNEKIRKQKLGLDTMMLKNIDEDGLVLSGGENQKLAIARALYKDGNAVILDEPTAALDALAEAEIYENFDSLIQHKTSIYISHRLASTKFCDKIALFSNANLLEYGNHAELMALKGEYYKMFVVQGKYYQKENLNESI